MDWSLIILSGYVTLLLGVVAYLIRSDLGGIRKRMDCFEHSQHACQLQNAKDYATWEQHNLLSDKVDRMDTRLTRTESRLDRQQ